ncbi:hypothetical protein IEQ34_008935 [Dendrobium chrysotoxum]|uniref:Uncharacterized protein n=1 Tax=Dendrobium chrysotoxum TaxID=161865 RepID=A0AAV7H1K7_DENCH|nr:hypothetical protein IEQ34_008935 [Dendrobium chrysotoxum]
MVVVNVSKSWIFYRIELNSKNMIFGISIVGRVEQTQEFCWESILETRGWRENKSKAMTTEAWICRHNGEGKAGGERIEVTICCALEMEWCLVKSMALLVLCRVG